MVEEGVRVRGQVDRGFVDAEEAGGGGGGGGGAHGGVGLRVGLRQVRGHELNQGVKPRVQQVGRVQGGDRDGGSGDERRLGRGRRRGLDLRLGRTHGADQGLLGSLGVFDGGGLLLLLGNQPWWTQRGGGEGLKSVTMETEEE